MRLTPIKVRGKGPRKAVFRPSERSKQLTRRGHAADVAAAESRKPAPIERLPTEILQRIFLFSAALNFPRASLRIGALLSPRSFRLELIILAFGPTWDVWFGVHSGNLVQSYYGWEDDLDRFGGDPKLQSEVISLPWVTYRWICDAMDVWLRQSGRGFQGPETKSALECFEDDFLDEELRFCGDREAHPSIRIPDRLLTGPSSMDDIKLLWWLTENHARYAEDQSWEMTLQGINNMPKLNDIQMCSLLHVLYDQVGGYDGWPRGIPDTSFWTTGELAKTHAGHELISDICWRLGIQI